MQKRVRNTVLFEENNLLCDDVGLFSGIVFFKNKNSYLIANYVYNGVLGGEYIPVCVSNNTSSIEIIDEDSIIFDGERATLNNSKIFTGVAIHFDKNGYSYYEEYFDEDGMRASDIVWNKDMTVKSFYLDHGEILESGELSDNNLKSYSLIGYLTFNFDTEGKIEYISIDKRALNLNQDEFKLLKFSPIHNIEDLVKWKFSWQLTFSGSYIDDNYISKIFYYDQIKDVKEINFYETNVSDYSFILKLNKIERINIVNNSSTFISNEEEIYNEKNNKILKKHLIGIIEKIKLKNRNIKIIFDETEI